MEKLDEMLKEICDLFYAIRSEELKDKLNYLIGCLIALRSIWQTGKQCNDCGNKDCEWKPKPGEQVRYNCAHWRGKDE